MTTGTQAVNLNRMCVVWALEDADEATAEIYYPLQNAADNAEELNDALAVNILTSKIHALRMEMQALSARIRNQSNN